MLTKTKIENRNSSISLIRCVAMMFIVTCHFFQFYNNELAWWFNVGVQMFFCISGFLYGNKKIDDSIGFVLKNYKKILIPYFSFLIPCIILYFVFAREYISIFSALKAVLCSGVVDGIGHLWFISYILFCYIITPFLYKFVNKIKEWKCVHVLIMFVMVLLGGQVVFLAYNSYFLFSRISCYIIGYFLAFILKQYGSIIFKRITWVFVIGAIICNLFRIFVKYYLKQTFFGFSFFEQYAHVLLGISIFLILYVFLKSVRYNRFLAVTDKYSYYIYIVHQLLILSPFSLMTLTKYMYLNWILVLLGVFLLAMVLKFISDRILLIVDKTENLFVSHISK